ncbi:tyrosine-type recombinase/integrase [Patescibacteria group bacterium]|nr:tyrosine-type recombinase/integrase [Patescibacteria group bacterium]
MKVNVKKAQKDFVQNLQREGKSTSTILAYNKDLDQLADYLVTKDITAIEDVKAEQLTGFIKAIAESSKLTPKSVSRKINSLKSFYKYLTTKDLVDTNVAEVLTHPKIETKEPRVLSKLEFMALREVARRDIKLYTMVEVFLQTGLRISELSGLKVEHLDLNEPATLFVPKRESQKERVVPLNKRVKEIIQNYLDVRQGDSPYLFATKSGRPLLIRNIRASMERLFKRAGLTGVTVNDLRHTFISHQLQRGVSVNTVCRVAGHKTTSTTLKYLKYLKLDKNGSKETLEEL